MSSLVAYTRVSTEAQTEGLGLEIQKAECVKWAVAHGHRIVATFTDAGISGSNGLEARTGLADAMRAVRERDGLVVYRLDRLARDLILQEQLLAELRRLGRSVFSTSASEAAYLEDDPGDPSRKMIRQVLGAVAEYERSMIALRLRAGRQRKRDGGGYAGGAPGFGWRALDGELVEVAHEQGVVARIRAWRAQTPAWSWRHIADELNATGTPSGRGGIWHPASCRNVALRNRTEGT